MTIFILCFFKPLLLNRTELFGSFIDCSKNQLKTNSKNQAGASNRSCVTKIKTDPSELAFLQQLWKEWKHDLKAFNLKLELQINNTLSKKEMQQKSQLDNQNSILTSTATSLDQADDFLRYYLTDLSKFDETIQIVNDLNSRFEQLIKKTENYMSKMNEFIQEYFK
jgi:hypothetical protein